MKKLQITTGAREEMINVTSALNTLVYSEGWNKGALLLFCPHTTAALTVNEAADPDVAADMRGFFSRMVPPCAEFRHAEGNSDAHIKASLLGPWCMLVVGNGEIQLGIWQGVYFCEWDGPRERSLWAQFLPGA